MISPDLTVVFAPDKIGMRKWLALEVLLFALVATPSIITPPHSLLSQASGSLQGSVRPLEAQGKVTAYTLPPDLYKRAKNLSRIHFLFNLVSFFYGLFVLWLVLGWRLAAKYRDWAEKLSSNRFLQAFVFTPPLILTIALLKSPTAIYEHVVSRTYGLTVEGRGALAWDWAKGIFILIVLGGILTWILYGMCTQIRN